MNVNEKSIIGMIADYIEAGKSTAGLFNLLHDATQKILRKQLPQLVIDFFDDAEQRQEAIETLRELSK